MDVLRPKPLKLCDTVGIISPSAGLPSLFPAVYENGLKIFEEWGLKVKEFPTARADFEYLQAHPEVRAQDVMDAFADPAIAAIITTIGGNDAVRLLPLLDLETIRQHPKILMGYSDTTALHFALAGAGLVTFYGPSIMAGLSQIDALEPSFKEHVRQMLFGEFNGQYKAYEQYANGYPDWGGPQNIGKVKEPQKNDGWHWLQGQGVHEGQLFGGCIELFHMISGTKWWPGVDFWKEKVLFFETSEEAPSVDFVIYQLRSMGVQGIFKNLRGLLIGRARDYTDDQKLELETRVLEQVRQEFGRPDLPIIANFDTGHTDPQLILPLNCPLTINCNNHTLKLVDTPTTV